MRAPDRRHAVILQVGIGLAVTAVVAMTAVAFVGLGNDDGTDSSEPNPAALNGSASNATGSTTDAAAPATAGPQVAGDGNAGGPVTPPGGWPNASNTGVPAGRPLQLSPGLRITRAGTVIDGLDVRGDISVEAPNVTIRNSRIVNNGEWGIIQRDSAGGLVVENVEIRSNGTDQLGKGIYNIGGMLTVRRSDISLITDGIMTSVGLIEDNFLHDPREFPGDHVDMIQAGSGPPDGQSLIVRRNTIINTRDQTSAVAMFQDFGVQHDVTVENNFLAGGGYTLYAGAGEMGASYNIKIINNVWSRQVFPNGGYFGPAAYFDKNGAGNVWSGNTWLDTGATLHP